MFGLLMKPLSMTIKKKKAIELYLHVMLLTALHEVLLLNFESMPDGSFNCYNLYVN